MDPARAARLRRTFDSIINGKNPLIPNKNSLFIEAICSQNDRVSCLNSLIASKVGLDSVQAAMRFDLTPDFLNSSSAQLLSFFFSSPELKDIGSGSFLDAVIAKIVDPLIFWDAFRQAFTSGLLENSARIRFAWLLHHLVSLPIPQSTIYRTQATGVLDTLLASSENPIRTYGQKIKHILETCSVGTVVAGDPGPGGRHDNDFENFREIAILPTADEITSTKRPFYRHSATVEADDESTRFATHIDNQFRLLREDMLYEMKEELQIAFGKKRGYHRGMTLKQLVLQDPHFGRDTRRVTWGMTFKCSDDLPLLQWKKEKNRKKYLSENKNFFRHQSMGCLMVDEEIVAFPTLNRDEDLLAKKPPVIVLQIEGEAAVSRTLLRLKTGHNIKLIQIDAAVFAYEPILKSLQQMNTLQLSRELMLWSPKLSVDSLPLHRALEMLVDTLRYKPTTDIKHLIKTQRSIKLDKSQAASFLSGITQSVSLIQGPPGTGKSFIGSLIGKALHDFTQQTILVVCYTNHALDDILTGFLDIGIPESSIVRLGSKSTSRTEPLSLQKQKSTFKRGKAGWALMDTAKASAEIYCQDFEKRFKTYISSNISNKDMMEYLEFEQEKFYIAFKVPRASDGSVFVGKKGKAVDDFYLLREWGAGRGARIFRDHPFVQQAADVWSLPPRSRKEYMDSWTNAIYQEQIDGTYRIAAAYNTCQDKLTGYWAEKDTEILRSKRIIGCTTTAAAKYSDNIQAAEPNILLVEEAGEILESHVLTSLAPQTSQLILIGDHKSISYPHAKLTEQHRMRPEISSLIRELTYPELVDSANTKNRPNLRGVQDNIIFIDHDHPEDNDSRLTERRDGESTSSKQNSHEVEMVIKILKYLAQQVYGTAAVVILTPYLGQLQQLRQALRKSNNDPVLNDLDSFDLVKAGLVPAATAAVGKRQIRLATIGEESDVVIVSLTRSNANNDIGFMFSPERLNVLLSRARHALIMIDNVRTFEKSKKGGNLWTHLFKQLKDGKHIYEGMPVRCEQHHNRTAILSRPEDFELHCPDGGCMEPCRTMLKCGQHSCQSKCHQLSDHSKMPCQYVMSAHCPKGHLQTWKCHGNGPSTCAKCEREAKAAEMKRQKDYEEQQKREADQVAHTRRLAELDEAIAQEEQRIHESRATKERVNAIQQKEKDLKAIKSRADNLSFSANLSAPLHRSYSLHLCQECLGPGPQVIVKQNHHMPPTLQRQKQHLK
ncbi:NFX1-type zinc finger-containing protein 1 [Termitomyces sp. T112]|nr:NFX1-type zinc finger-containing protein 1 [Termitomyces sp. T112]